MHIVVKVLEEREEIDLVRNLLYRVYCVEQGVIYGPNDIGQKVIDGPSGKMVVDDFDETSIWTGAILYEDGKSPVAIGCTRMSKGGLPELSLLPNHHSVIDDIRSSNVVVEHLRTAVDKAYRGRGAFILNLLYYVGYTELCMRYGDAVVVGTSANPIHTKATLRFGSCVVGSFIIEGRNGGKPCDLLLTSSAGHVSSVIWNMIKDKGIRYDSTNNSISQVIGPTSSL